MNKNIKKYLETFVETAALMGTMAAIVGLGLVLMGREDIVQNQNVTAILWYLVAGLLLYVGYKIFSMKLNQK